MHIQLNFFPLENADNIIKISFIANIELRKELINFYISSMLEKNPLWNALFIPSIVKKYGIIASTKMSAIKNQVECVNFDVQSTNELMEEKMMEMI